MYLPISAQRKKFDSAPSHYNSEVTISGPHPDSMTLSDDIQIIWMDRMKGGTGMVLKHPNPYLGQSTKGRYQNELLPAYTDISSLEDSGQLPGERIVLHRMGYGTSYGIRDLTVFNPDRSFDLIAFGIAGETMRKQGTLDKDCEMHEAMAKYFVTLLREAPGAAFFVHRLGSEADFSVTETLFRAAYSIAGTNYHELEVPEEQIDNLQLLLFLADLDNPSLLLFGTDNFDESRLDSNRSVSNLCRRMFTYVHEADQAEYWVISNGQFIGFNNKRAMPGYLKQVDELLPDKPILVHRMGDKVDFDLERKLRGIDVSTDMIERQERFKI